MSEQGDTPCATTLPPELLSRIFEHYIAACKAVWDDGAPYDRIAPASCSHAAIGPYTWLHATHVCTYWRAVALANPLLWSHTVLVRSVPCVQAVLTRSQQVPLTIQSYTPRCSSEGAFPTCSLKLALQHIHRVRSLELRIKWWVFFDHIAPALEHPTPLLARVHIATPSGLADDFPLAPALDLAAAAPLRELELSAYGFPWARAAPFCGLRSLTVRRSAGRSPAPIDVLTALAHMPLLAALTLDNVFGPSPKDTSALALLPTTVALPELETLTFAGDSAACTTLLCALRTPAPTRTTLSFRSAAAAELNLCVPAVCAHLALGTYTVRIREDSGCFAVLFFPAQSGPTPRVTLQIPSTTVHFVALLLALPKTMPLCVHELPLPPALAGSDARMCAAGCGSACAQAAGAAVMTDLELEFVY
ncbi:hypothetical protein PHLGIDRAFT_381807 [Phlebiopsis gigantea 11061_1 CR5-6]|uniref:Uncharacterized protein n=1 Tax=Phlebiopsis gigantea (strain 11061_1 CR5-6) TaxID=745531 RepID=A0A0C3N9M3_PHLG1|nr:hypothetical protein PHLGIDRAFT_381807 [Phlebiopsis gigantea 11061_1 CR5-6]